MNSTHRPSKQVSVKVSILSGGQATQVLYVANKKKSCCIPEETFIRCNRNKPFFLKRERIEYDLQTKYRHNGKNFLH